MSIQKFRLSPRYVLIDRESLSSQLSDEVVGAMGEDDCLLWDKLLEQSIVVNGFMYAFLDAFKQGNTLAEITFLFAGS